jgi:hypothetical protein
MGQDQHLRSFQIVDMLQVQAEATLPSPQWTWLMDTAHPPPLGRHLRTASFSFVSAHQSRAVPIRSNLLAACHLELAASSLYNVSIPYRVNVDQIADDGDGFALALHAIMLAQMRNGLGSKLLNITRNTFSSVGIAGVATVLTSFQGAFHWGLVLDFFPWSLEQLLLLECGYMWPPKCWQWLRSGMSLTTHLEAVAPSGIEPVPGDV